MFHSKRWWIIGASEGLGRALAEALDEAGASVVVSARNATRLSELATELNHAEPIAMDVRDATSVRAACAAIGEVDGVIYCAGLYDPMRAQDWDAEQAEAMCDVNFMGAMRVLAHIAPAFARRDEGHIVLIGSLAGYAGLPGAIGYGASKAALMHLGETLQADFKGSGVKVQVINPGFIETRLTAKNSFDMPMIQTPQKAAEACIRAIRSGRLHNSFPAPFSWLFRIAALLPRAILQRVL